MALPNTGKEQLDPSKAPTLPFAPVQYDRTYQDTLNNILRQYFNTVDNLNVSLLQLSGARFLSTPSASFISTSDQTAAVINTAYAVTVSAVNGTVNNDIFIGTATANSFPNSEIYVTYPGIYNLQFSLQLNNADTQEHDVNIWLRKNGNNEANTNSVVGVPSSHGGIDGHAIAAWNFFIEWTDVADYYELAWSTPDLDVKIDYKAAASPAPATPSVIMTLHYVSRL